MKEIKIYARAGQGAITTAAILGEALFYEGIYAYAFPHFGAARMGAPMNAFLRFDDEPIRMRFQVYEPDYAIVMDPQLITGEECLASLKKDGVAIRDDNVPEASVSAQLITIPAKKIAMEVIGKPFTNTVLLGAFSKATGEVSLDSLITAMEKRFVDKPEVLGINIEAVRRGYDVVS